jgi:hypothetical protein
MENAGQPVAGRERHDVASPGVKERIVLYDQPCNARLGERIPATLLLVRAILLETGIQTGFWSET